MLFTNQKNNYTLYGTTFGLCFPLGAIGLELFLRDLSLSLDSIIYLHQEVLLLWMIDSAPFVLGFFARFAGIKQDEVVQTVSNMQKIIDERTAVLEQSKNDAEKASLEKSQLNELSQIASLATNSRELAANVLKFLVGTSGSQTGIIYTASKNSLHLLASHAFKANDEHPDEIPFGESQLGQCAMEQKIFHLRSLKNNYLRIESSIGSASANSVLMIPIMFEGKLTGVMELGTFGEYTDEQINFLKQCCEVIAISLNSILSREKLSELVKQLELNQKKA